MRHLARQGLGYPKYVPEVRHQSMPWNSPSVQRPAALIAPLVAYPNKSSLHAACRCAPCAVCQEAEESKVSPSRWPL